MKSLLSITIALIFTLLTNTLNAQMRYDVTVKNEAYQSLTQQATTLNTGVWDDENFAIPLDFKVDLNGKTVDTVYLLAGNILATDSAESVSGIMALGVDLADKGTTTSLSPIRYEVTGTAGSRIFKLEMANVGFASELDDHGTQNDSLDLQVWVYETTNVVELRFGKSNITHFADYFGFTGVLMGCSNYAATGSGDDDKLYTLKGDYLNPTIDSFSIANVNVGLTSYPTTGTVYRFTPKKTTAVTDVAVTSALKLYPTQCSHTLNVENPVYLPMNYRVVSMMGKEVSKGIIIPKGKSTIDVENYASGMYLLSVNYQRVSSTYKFVKY